MPFQHLLIIMLLILFAVVCMMTHAVKTKMRAADFESKFWTLVGSGPGTWKL